jgi:hypothetical protein
VSIFKVQKELIELTTMELHPSRSFSSGSDAITNASWAQDINNSFVSGTIGVVARPSKAFKDFPDTISLYKSSDPTPGGPSHYITTSPFSEALGTGVGGSPYDFSEMIKHSFTDGVVPDGSDIFDRMAAYVGYPASIRSSSNPRGSDGLKASTQGVVNALGQPGRNKKKKEIKLFRPPYRVERVGQQPSGRYSDGSGDSNDEAGHVFRGPRGTLTKGLSGSHRLVKDYIRKVLIPDNAQRYTDSQYAYKNYNTLNFFTSSGTPEGACLIYNNTTGAIPPLSAPYGSAWPTFSTNPSSEWSRENLLAHPANSGENISLQAGRGPYTPTSSFTIEFYVNPRYTNDSADLAAGKTDEFASPFNAGTILHMPTVFAVSLVSGSSVGKDGLVDGYRIMLQLSHSAEIPPHDISITGSANYVNDKQYSHDLIFLTDDNSLKRNHWHYVAIRWGTKLVNAGTGSILIDGQVKGTFHIPSMSIAAPLPVIFQNEAGAVMGLDSTTNPTRYARRTNGYLARSAADPSPPSPQVPDPDILVVGNFYQGPGTGSLCPETSKMYNFFNTAVSGTDGVIPVRHRNWSIDDGTDYITRLTEGYMPLTDPNSSGVPLFTFSNQLNAEIHEIKIYDRYRNLEDIITGSREGPGMVTEHSASWPLYRDPNGRGPVMGSRVVMKAAPADDSLLFYLPCLFVKESPDRSFLLNCVESFKKDFFSARKCLFGNGSTGVDIAAGPNNLGYSVDKERLYPPAIIDPDSSTSNAQGSVLSHNSGTMLGRPFNAGLSLNVDATLINVENFCREFIAGQPWIPVNDGDPYGFKRGNYPRLMHMTASSIAQKDPPVFRTPTHDYFDIISGYNRFGMNIGRVNSRIAENVYRDSIGDSLPLPDRYTGRGNNNPPSYVDGKFLTSVSGALDNFYATGSLVRRNLAILPNDNGLFKPNFAWLLSSSMIDVETGVPLTDDYWDKLMPAWDSPMSIFVDDLGNLDLTLIGLQNLFERKPGLKSDLSISAASYADGGWEHSAETRFLTGTVNYNFSQKPDGSEEKLVRSVFFNPRSIAGGEQDIVSPDNPDGWAINTDINGKVSYFNELTREPKREGGDNFIEPSYDFWVYQTTGDPSSNEVVIFDISNLFYGQRISGETLTLKDPYYKGSRGKISIALRDDGNGGIFRADCLTKQAEWANVGNVFYNEGLGIIKSPHLAHFGKDYFEVSLSGEQNLHVMTVNAFCPANAVNSSSNPSYKLLSASSNANDTAPEFTYVTSVNLHDDNLNVIMRANFAQPVLKRWVEEYLFKIKIDF